MVIILGIRFTTNDVLLFIDNKSSSTYTREQLGSPDLFKTVTIKNDDSLIGLGCTMENNTYYYCIHGTKKYRGKFYSSYLGSVEHDITMKAEIVFEENDICVGSTLDAYVVIYYDGNNSAGAWVEAKISFDEVGSNDYLRYTVDETTMLDYPFSNYNNVYLDSLSNLFIRDCFDAFNEFLIANDFKVFHKK